MQQSRRMDLPKKAVITVAYSRKLRTDPSATDTNLID